MDLDLHIHSTASDGALPPSEVVDRAVEAGLHVIALTDHDTTAGFAEAKAAVGGRALEVIPALEVSTTSDREELHILGYFVDPEHREILGHRLRAGRRREERIRAMLERLEGQGVEVPFETVVEAAGGSDLNLGRPHLAKALVQTGYASTVSDAFDRLIGNQHRAYIPTDLGAPERGIEIILEAGGIPVWAHPPIERVDALLPSLVRAGLRGLEVYRPRTPNERTLRLEALARSAGLLVSGGSDWHGPDDGELGEFRVRSDEVGGLLEEGGL